LPETIRTLIDRRERAEPSVLPEELRIAYGGDLWFPPSRSQRPYVIGNFVSTVDGVVSYEIAGESGGGNISGFDESDRFIMGLLRASADAVMVGSGTLHQTTPEHLFVAGHVCLEALTARRSPLGVMRRQSSGFPHLAATNLDRVCLRPSTRGVADSPIFESHLSLLAISSSRLARSTSFCEMPPAS
jgi:hypothetical protein